MPKKLLGGQESGVIVEYALILAAIAVAVVLIYTYMPRDLLYLP